MRTRFAEFCRKQTVRGFLVVPFVLSAACGAEADDPGAGGGGDTQRGAIEGVLTERIGPYGHPLDDISYDRPAPSGGDHPPAPYWLTCGVYEGEVPDELAVHSLEHGAVWIALGPDSTDADRAAAADLAQGAKVIVSDVPDLPNPVELVAWGHRLPLETASDERAARFVEQFVDGPGAPEAGLSCDSFGDPPTPPEFSPA
jgi:Protein of unknown function (DUF3105)